MCRRTCRDLLNQCLDCERERAAHLEAAREFDLLCQSDPRLDPAHRYASDREYREFVEATTLPARPETAAA